MQIAPSGRTVAVNRDRVRNAFGREWLFSPAPLCGVRMLPLAEGELGQANSNLGGTCGSRQVGRRSVGSVQVGAGVREFTEIVAEAIQHRSGIVTEVVISRKRRAKGVKSYFRSSPKGIRSFQVSVCPIRGVRFGP